MKVALMAFAMAGLGACDMIEPFEVPTDAVCPDTVFASTGTGLCGVVQAERGVAYPCVSTCEDPAGAPVAPGCHASARMRTPFEGANPADAIGGQVICGCGESCK